MVLRLILHGHRVVIACLLVVGGSLQWACADPPVPIATPTVGLSRTTVPLGGPLEVNIRFDVAPDVAPLTEDYRVLLHFLNTDTDLLWAEDHDPPVPTSTWQSGERVEYARRMTVPMYPYIGKVVVAVGLYSPTTSERLPLAGDDLGQQAYRVASLDLAPQQESSFLVYNEGWHPPEFGEGWRDEWRWTTGRAVLSLRNPGTDASLTIDLAGRPDMLDGGQTVSLVVDDRVLEEIVLETNRHVYVERSLSAADLGTSEIVTLELRVAPTFVPSEHSAASEDTRELGVRVFYTFFEPR